MPPGHEPIDPTCQVYFLKAYESWLRGKGGGTGLVDPHTTHTARKYPACMWGSAALRYFFSTCLQRQKIFIYHTPVKIHSNKVGKYVNIEIAQYIKIFL